MDIVLEKATVLSVGKLACSLPFVPFLSTSSPISLCCCCLLIFTDVAVTAFFSVFLVLKRWHSEVTSADDAVTVRCLLFICHTYGAVFLFTLPAIVLDTLLRLLQEEDSDRHRTEKLKDDKSAEGGGGEEEPVLGHHKVAYLCCLCLWIVGTLSIRRQWEQVEEWTVIHLYSTNSLLTSLPNIYSPILRYLPPCWVMVLLYLALAIILAFSFGLFIRKPTLIQLTSPGVDPGKAENSCKVQMSHLKDLERLSPGSLKSENTDSQPVGPRRRCGQAFPCPRADVMIGVTCAIAIFALPLNLGVNIHLISSIEKALELGIKYIYRRFIMMQV